MDKEIEYNINEVKIDKKKFIYWLNTNRIITFLSIGIAIFIVILSYLRSGKVEFVASSIILPLIIIGILIGATVLSKIPLLRFLKSDKEIKLTTRINETLKYWGTLAIIVFIYENLRNVVNWENRSNINDWLLKADIAIFGVEPTLWLQKFYNPILVDIMAAFYALYFAIPVLVMFLLYIKNKKHEFQHVSISLILTLYIGYLGYILFPAAPPRFAIAQLFTDQPTLAGYIFHDTMQRIWDRAALASHYCAFPSLHVGLSSIGIIWCIYFRKIIPGAKIVLPIVIFSSLMLWFSTVYLRHHWIIDLFAGAAIAIFSSVVTWIALNVIEKRNKKVLQS